MKKIEIEETVEFLNTKYPKPFVGIVLGTGLNSLIEKIDNAISISYADIPNFVTSTVEFHKGELIFGNINNCLLYTSPSPRDS